MCVGPGSAEDLEEGVGGAGTCWLSLWRGRWVAEMASSPSPVWLCGVLPFLSFLCVRDQ